MAAQHEELEAVLGEGVRAVRIIHRLTQIELADRANVSVGSLKNLESGRGSTTSTLVKVAHALGQDHWLRALAPATTSFNPLDLLKPRQSKERQAPRRVRHSPKK
jgi:transcriptional regulator with XRE-family HTH domain